ncbi:MULTISPECIES: hypothetical protein [Oxalobacteraceae]|uniref:hypothetical protein n=1 Tax=Herminiimonas sp. Marseille-P9896 TaxID=2742211 RepID=UPI00158DAD74|nr:MULTISPECIES: hypothetical protein [Oxalobacteraceae]
MHVAFRVEENAEGRWHWFAVSQDGGVLTGFNSSPVEFDTEDEANNDLKEHLACKMTHPKLIRPIEQLMNLIDITARRCPGCLGATFTNIQWHEPDGNGCNWNIQYVNAPDVPECMSTVWPVVEQLRHNYNIPDPI